MRAAAMVPIGLLCLVLCFAANSYGQGGGQSFDLLIKNGHVVDGTGNAWYPTFTKYFNQIERQGISVNLAAPKRP